MKELALESGENQGSLDSVEPIGQPIVSTPPESFIRCLVTVAFALGSSLGLAAAIVQYSVRASLMSIPLLGSAGSFLGVSTRKPRNTGTPGDASMHPVADKPLPSRVAEVIAALQKILDTIQQGHIRQEEVDNILALVREVLSECREAAKGKDFREHTLIAPAYRLWHVCISLLKAVDEYGSCTVDEEPTTANLRELDCFCREIAAWTLEQGIRDILNSYSDGEEARSQRDNMIKIWLRTGQSWLSLVPGNAEQWTAGTAALTRGITIFKKAVTELSEESVSDITKNAAYSGALCLAQGLCLTGNWDGAVQTISSCRGLLSTWVGYRRVEASLELACQCRDIATRMIRAAKSPSGKEWAIGLPGWSSSSTPVLPGELGKVANLLKCALEVVSDDSSPATDNEASLVVQLSKTRSEVYRVLAEVLSMQGQGEKALESIQNAIREDIQHKQYEGYYESIRVAAWVILNTNPETLKSGTTEKLIKTGELKRLVEEYCAASTEVPSELQPGPSSRLLNLVEPLVHAVVALCKPHNRPEFCSARLEEMVEALSLVMRSLERECAGSSLALMAARIADAIGTLSRSISRGSEKGADTRLGGTASNGLSSLLRDIVLVISAKSPWVDEVVKSQCSGIVWNMAAGLYTCGDYVAASTWFELCQQVVDEESEYRCWQARALCSYRACQYEEGVRLARAALRLCSDATARSQPLLAMVNCAIDGQVSGAVTEIIGELEKIAASSAEGVSPQLLVAVLNKFEGLEGMEEYVSRCLKLIGQYLCRGSDGPQINLLDRLTIFRCIAKNAVDGDDSEAALHYVEAVCDSLSGVQLEDCQSDQEQVVDQIAALFKIGWNLGVRLVNCDDQEESSPWDAAFRAFRSARTLIDQFLLPHEKAKAERDEKESLKLTEDSRMCLIFMLTALTRLALSLENSPQESSDNSHEAEQEEPPSTNSSQARGLAGLTAKELYKVGLGLLKVNQEMDNGAARSLPLMLLFEFKCTVGALSGANDGETRLAEVKRILEDAQSKRVASKDWLEILTSWCLNRRPPAFGEAGMVLAVLTSSPRDAGRMLPVYYREWLRAQEGADDSTLQILGTLLTLLDEAVQSNGASSLAEIGYNEKEIKWVLCYSWDRAVRLYRRCSYVLAERMMSKSMSFLRFALPETKESLEGLMAQAYDQCLQRVPA